MRVSERGQVTIPKKLRERVGLVHNVEVDVTPTSDGVIIRKKGAGQSTQEAREQPVGTVEVQPAKEPRERHWSEPFDLEAFLNDPNPKIFDPDKVVISSRPFDVDAFNSLIRESRDMDIEGS